MATPTTSDDSTIRLAPEIVDAARTLAAGPERRLLGIAGPPAAGKSTFAEVLTRELGPCAAHVPMDGFHLSQHQLDRLGRQNRKGAPDTFDAGGYGALLRRLAADTGETIFAPDLNRHIEEPIAAALAVDPAARLIVTEGNYLLLEDAPWPDVAAAFDTIWYIDVAAERREDWLLARHRSFGAQETGALQWIASNDRPNAARVIATAGRADRRLTWVGRTAHFLESAPPAA